jgi:hypothetical protein
MTLETPLSLHEGAVSKLRIRGGSGELIPDAELEAVAAALQGARAECERTAALHTAVMADNTVTPGAAALRVRECALKGGERASEKLDTARARISREIERLRRETWAPPTPRDQAGMEGEVRAALCRMPEKDRAAALAKAITVGDDVIVGAAFRGPAMLSGLTDAELEMRRTVWRQKTHPQAFDREQRLGRALTMIDTGGKALVSFVEAAASSPAAEAADRGRKRVDEAVAAMGEGP